MALSSGMWQGGTGLVAFANQLDVIGNNLANSTTAAFKRQDAVFADIFYEAVHPAGSPAEPPSGLGVSYGYGTQIAGTPLDFSQGPTVAGIDLDVLIAGDGFFRVLDETGKAFYTRLGAFQPKGVGAAGALNLQLSGRSFVLDPAITLPGVNDDVRITPEGDVFQGEAFAGRFELVDFRNPSGLLARENLLFEESLASGPPVLGAPGGPGFGLTVSNSLEGSNVDFASELVTLIDASRGFQLSSESFRVGNEEVIEAIGLADRS